MYRGRWSICLPIEVWEKWAGIEERGERSDGEDDGGR